MVYSISGALFIIEGVPLCCEQILFDNLTEECENWSMRHINGKLCFIIEEIHENGGVLLHHLNLEELKYYCDDVKCAIEYECAVLNFYGIGVESHIFVVSANDGNLIDTIKAYGEIVNATINPSS